MGGTGGWVLFCSEWLAVFVEFVRRGSDNTVSVVVPNYYARGETGELERRQS